MMRSKSLILTWNSSRTGKAISASSFSGVWSSFSGGRRMVKCTRSTAGSAFSSRRQVRSPECGSPEVSSTAGRARGQPYRAARTGDAEVLDDRAQGDGLADQAVGRRLDDPQPAVSFLPGGGDQHVQRAAVEQFRRLLRGGRVMDLAVGQQDRAGEAAARNVGQ